MLKNIINIALIVTGASMITKGIKSVIKQFKKEV